MFKSDLPVCCQLNCHFKDDGKGFKLHGVIRDRELFN